MRRFRDPIPAALEFTRREPTGVDPVLAGPVTYGSHRAIGCQGFRPPLLQFPNISRGMQPVGLRRRILVWTSGMRAMTSGT